MKVTFKSPIWTIGTAKNAAYALECQLSHLRSKYAYVKIIGSKSHTIEPGLNVTEIEIYYSNDHPFSAPQGDYGK